MRWVLPNLPDFQTRYPEYTLHLITQLIHDKPFNRAEYDLAIIGMPRPEVYTDMRIECICREKLVPVCAPALLEGRIRCVRRRICNTTPAASLAGSGCLGSLAETGRGKQYQPGKRRDL
jgi:DNA-binding transcriptional LysR family regulator